MKNMFNQLQFSILLKKAIGSRMQKDFAETIGITPAHLSRILNHKFNTPPSVDTLKKIAANAENNVTYRELMEVCGYVGDNTSDIEYTLPAEPASSYKFVKATILTALESGGLAYEIVSPNEDSPYDLAIRINNPERLEWFFKFLSQKAEDQMRRQLSGNYLELLFQKSESSQKVSFVTCSRKEYEIYLDKLPESLNRNLSIILVNEAELDIQEERWLSRALPYKKAIDNLLLSK